MNSKIKTRQELETLLHEKNFNTYYGVKGNTNNSVGDIDMNKRVVTGVNSTAMYFDSDADILLGGNANKSIAERGPKSNAEAKIKNVKDHILNRRIGVGQVLEERKIKSLTQIYFESKMMNNTDGNDTLIEYQEGGIDQHSIGFQYVGISLVTADDAEWKDWLSKVINPEDMESNGYAFLVSEIKLFEWSPVSFGANKLTPYLGVKSTNKEGMIIKLFERFDLLQKWLTHGRQSDERMNEYELEVLQIKQLTKELLQMQPSVKDILINERIKQTHPETEDAAQKEMTLRYCANCLTTFNAGTGEAKCPECGQYTNDNGMRLPNMDIGKAIDELDMSKIFK
jgi:hypothetical protein